MKLVHPQPTVENVIMNESNLCYCILTLQYVKRHCVAGYLLVIVIITTTIIIIIIIINKHLYTLSDSA